MARSKHYYIRKTHRWLGVILGIQFLFWTIGGLYFSWTDLDEIHGDFQRKSVPLLSGNIAFVSPENILKQKPGVDSLHSIELINILGKAHYTISYFSSGRLYTILADAATGIIREPVTKEEAIRLAATHFNGEPTVEEVEYITTTNGHHEYREKPLPAWAVTFAHPTSTTVYVSAATGRVESFRNNKWRVFDFLWMMHTMDYRQRDDFNNWLLRAFSVFGLTTILSGFVLFIASSRRKRIEYRTRNKE